MGFLYLFFLIIGLVFVLIAVHETGHYLAGMMGGIPARDMKLVLFAFPQHVAVRDGGQWVSPVLDIERYIDVTSRHLVSRWAAFCWVAGGMVLELAFTTAVWAAAILSGYRAVAFVTACISFGMYAINVFLMDLPWALRYRRAVGDTSGLWQIAPLAAVVFSAVMVASRVMLVLFSIGPTAGQNAVDLIKEKGSPQLTAKSAEINGDLLLCKELDLLDSSKELLEENLRDTVLVFCDPWEGLMLWGANTELKMKRATPLLDSEGPMTKKTGMSLLDKNQRSKLLQPVSVSIAWIDKNGRVSRMVDVTVHELQWRE